MIPTEKTNYYPSVLYSMISSDENILWSGKPNFKCFILETIFNPLLPFALVWALFDSLIIGVMFLSHKPNTGVDAMGVVAMCGFFALHLMPVWIYLGGIVFSFRRHRHTEFILTDKCVYTSGGIFAQTFQALPIKEVRTIAIHRGMIDQWLGVGDIVLSQTQDTSISPLPISIPAKNFRKTNTQQKNTEITDIPDFQRVYELLKELQTKTN